MSLRLIPLFLALAWGLNWPAVKIALSALAPFTLRAVGLGSGALLLLLLLVWQRKRLLPPRSAWPGVVVGGLLTIAVFNLATAWAQLSTTTSRAAVMTFTMPMMSALLSWWWLGDKPDRHRTLALALGTAGVAVLAWPVLSAIVQGGDTRLLKGLAFPLIAAAGWSSGTVILKRWPVEGDRLVITAWQLLIGAAAGATGALLTGEPAPAWPLPARVSGALLFHVVIGTSLAYWAWFVLSERVSATVSSLTTLTVPVVGVLGAMALVGDRPSALDWLGFALVLGGAALVMLKLPPRNP